MKKKNDNDNSHGDGPKISTDVSLILRAQGPLLLIWFIFNPNMDK